MFVIQELHSHVLICMEDYANFTEYENIQVSITLSNCQNQINT